MKIVLLMATICLTEISLGAQEAARATNAEITEAGIYTAEVVRRVEVPGIVGGTWKGLDSFTLLQATTNVPARVGTTFGFRYKISATPSNAPILLTMVGEHPPITDPKTGKTQTRDTYQFTTSRRETFAAFSFDEKWKVAPGRWRFEIWHADQKLCEQEFVVLGKSVRITHNAAAFNAEGWQAYR